MTRKRIPSGIDGLDGMIEGGFIEGQILLLAGNAGAGKTTFLTQFIYNGAVRYNECGMFVSFEEPKDLLFENMQRYGWDLQSLEKRNKAVFLEYPTQDIEHFLSHENIIRDTIEENNIKRVAIDTITSYALIYETEYKRRQEVARLLNKLRKWGCTIMMSSESYISEREYKIRFGMDSLCDGLIYLYNIREAENRIRALEVMKLRGTNHAQRMVPLRFTEKGLVVYPNEHVFEGGKIYRRKE
ncbi:MAG: ATPase domain-containing protein [Candidatus Micrarchaeia archaeon]